MLGLGLGLGLEPHSERLRGSDMLPAFGRPKNRPEQCGAPRFWKYQIECYFWK